MIVPKIVTQNAMEIVFHIAPMFSLFNRTLKKLSNASFPSTNKAFTIMEATGTIAIIARMIKLAIIIILSKENLRPSNAAKSLFNVLRLNIMPPPFHNRTYEQTLSQLLGLPLPCRTSLHPKQIVEDGFVYHLIE